MTTVSRSPRAQNPRRPQLRQHRRLFRPPPASEPIEHDACHSARTEPLRPSLIWTAALLAFPIAGPAGTAVTDSLTALR